MSDTTSTESQHEGETQGTVQSYRSYKDVVKIMSEKFNTEDNIHSTALDIISLYLKGQKIIQMESKIYCEYYLYRLMLPAIFISSASSVISGIFKDNPDAVIAVCLLTALNAFILSIITYLKLDAKAEAHKSSAYSYDKLQTMCEFNSGRILLHTVKSGTSICELMGEILNDIEKQVMEIKDRNQFIVPSYIRYNYPKLYFTNIFTIVKQIQNEEMIHINNLKVIMNKGADITNEILAGNKSPAQLEKKRQHYIEKNKAINRLIEFREKYLDIDDEFKLEIEQNTQRKNRAWYECCCKYSGKYKEASNRDAPENRRQTLGRVTFSIDDDDSVEV
jgi:hypothetical protein